MSLPFIDPMAPGWLRLTGSAEISRELYEKPIKRKSTQLEYKTLDVNEVILIYITILRR